jgi:RNA polymerase sigma factor (sigma-70 family)
MYINPESSSRLELVDRLLSKHQDRIRHFIGRRSGSAVLNRTTIDDLYQETAATAISCADGFEYVDDARFISWVSTIARRVISNSLFDPRRLPPTLRIRRARSSGVGVSETRIYARNRTPSSAVAENERSDALRQAINELPEHYRTVLTLYRIEERPLAEVAARMQRTKGATCRLIARAIALLRETLREE